MIKQTRIILNTKIMVRSMAVTAAAILSRVRVRHPSGSAQ
jgi:hypothetical protein